MVIRRRRDEGVAETCGRNFVITSEVRNELNGRRRLHDRTEVVNVVTADGRWGHPYMPRPFPKGSWRVTGAEESRERTFAPVKIKTDAHQRVELWNLDADGGYDKPSGIYAEDWGYHLHWSEHSRTTLGCGRIGTGTGTEALRLAALAREARGRGEEVTLEVS